MSEKLGKTVVAFVAATVFGFIAYHAPAKTFGHVELSERLAANEQQYNGSRTRAQEAKVVAEAMRILSSEF